MNGAEARPGWPTRIARIIALVIASMMLAIVAAWLVGRIISDRYSWSQWLLWIPTPAALLAALIGLPALFAAARRRANRRVLLGWWGAGLVAMAVYFGAVEHRLYRAGPLNGPGIRIVHWSMSHTKEPFLPQAQTILSHEPDLAVLNDAWRATDPAFTNWAEVSGGVSTRADRFTILSTMPIIENRVLVKSDGMVVVLLRVDATEKLGRELSALLVDLPSSPRMPRWETAQRLRRLLDEADAPAPDIVVGDLNLTRGGSALHSIFPQLHHAYDDAGGGYAASFRREWPLYHIDHVLLSDAMRATSYRLVDPGIGRHRMQVATVANR